MKKVTLLILVLVIIAVPLMMAAAHPFTSMARLTIVNRTGKTVKVSLLGSEKNYYLTVLPGVRVFTVVKDIYRVSWLNCKERQVDDWDITSQLEMTLNNCRGAKNTSSDATKKHKNFGGLPAYFFP